MRSRQLSFEQQRVLIPPNTKPANAMSPRQSEVAAMEMEDETPSEEQPRRRKKTRLFADSNLTDAQRREIRLQQREIQGAIREGACATVEDLASARQENNEIFAKKVCFTREAVLDAENVGLIATQYAKQVEKQVQVPRFDARGLVRKLKQKCSNKSSTSQYLDWKVLGIEAGICFNAVPECVSFLAGALDQEVTLKQKAARKPREKMVVDQSEEVKPESVQNSANQSDADKLSAMEKAMGVLRKKLNERTNQEKANKPSKIPDLDGVQFLFNPKSFTQTVENVFNFSFLIKKGEAAIGLRQNILGPSPTTSDDSSLSGLYVGVRHHDIEAAQSTAQAVCCFTMQDWHNLVKKQHLQKGDLPHRTGTKHGRASVL